MNNDPSFIPFGGQSENASKEIAPLETPSRFKRWVAFCFDSALIGLLGALAALPLAALCTHLIQSLSLHFATLGAQDSSLFISTALSGVLAKGIATLFIGVFYYIGSEVCFSGATPGKMLLGLAAVSADGAPISPAQAVIRYFARYVFLVPMILSVFFIYALPPLGIILFIPLIVAGGIIASFGYPMYLFNEHARALHDIIARCRVVKRSDSRAAVVVLMLVLSLAFSLVSSALTRSNLGSTSTPSYSFKTPQSTISSNEAPFYPIVTPTPPPTTEIVKPQETIEDMSAQLGDEILKFSEATALLNAGHDLLVIGFSAKPLSTIRQKEIMGLEEISPQTVPEFAMTVSFHSTDDILKDCNVDHMRYFEISFSRAQIAPHYQAAPRRISLTRIGRALPDGELAALACRKSDQSDEIQGALKGQSAYRLPDGTQFPMQWNVAFWSTVLQKKR